MSFISESQCFKSEVDASQVELIMEGLAKGQYEPHKALAKYDLLGALKGFKCLRPGFDKFVTSITGQRGEVQTLLNLKGTIPITHNGDVHNILVIFWLERDYPTSPPIGFVLPAIGVQINRQDDNNILYDNIKVIVI